MGSVDNRFHRAYLPATDRTVIGLGGVDSVRVNAQVQP